MPDRLTVETLVIRAPRGRAEEAHRLAARLAGELPGALQGITAEAGVGRTVRVATADAVPGAIRSAAEGAANG